MPMVRCPWLSGPPSLFSRPDPSAADLAWSTSNAPICAPGRVTKCHLLGSFFLRFVIIAGLLQKIEWSQKNKQKIIFKTEKYNGLNPDINFSSTIFLNNNSIAKAGEISKKKAEEKVAKRAYHALKLNFINLK